MPQVCITTPSIVQFVDAIASSPTLRLDLNVATGPLATTSIDISPPTLRRAINSTMLADGDRVTASAYGNRVIKLEVQLVNSTQTAAATALTNLARELNRSSNILRVRLGGISSDVFFRTYRAPDFTLSMLRVLLAIGRVVLDVPAEPFGYGNRVDVTPLTVNNDPVSGTNPCRFDITGVTGDVETPALIDLDPGANNFAPVLSVRRHGTPSNLTGYYQAESGTLQNDTTSVAAVAAHSNSTVARTSFATVPGMATRIVFAAIPGPATGVDLRGFYRIFIMVASSTATSTYGIRFRLASSVTGADLVLGDTALFVPPDTGRYLIELGLIQVPVGADPGFDGYGAALAVTNMELRIQEQRLTGAGSLDADFIATIPVGEEYAAIDTAVDPLTLDGPNDVIWAPDVSGNITSAAVPMPAWISSLPLLTPNQTNRFYLLRPDGLAGGAEGRGPDTKTRTTAVSVSYWPRYLVIAS